MYIFVTSWWKMGFGVFISCTYYWVFNDAVFFPSSWIQHNMKMKFNNIFKENQRRKKWKVWMNKFCCLERRGFCCISMCSTSLNRVFLIHCYSTWGYWKKIYSLFSAALHYHFSHYFSDMPLHSQFNLFLIFHNNTPLMLSYSKKKEIIYLFILYLFSQWFYLSVFCCQ